MFFIVVCLFFCLLFDLNKLNLGVCLIDILEAYTKRYTHNYYFPCHEHKIFEISEGVRNIFTKYDLRIVDLKASQWLRET